MECLYVGMDARQYSMYAFMGYTFEKLAVWDKDQIRWY